MSVTQAAGQLGVSRVALSRVLNGRAAISPEMALRIQAWMGKERGGDARVWLAEQSAHDVWHTEQRLKAPRRMCNGRPRFKSRPEARHALRHRHRHRPQPRGLK